MLCCSESSCYVAVLRRRHLSNMAQGCLPPSIKAHVMCRFGKDRAEAILQDASLSHAERTAALQRAREALEAELRAKGMFRLEVSPVFSQSCKVMQDSSL